MTVVRCNVKDCSYRGIETCRAARIAVNANGECKTICTYAELMKERRSVDADKCK